MNCLKARTLLMIENKLEETVPYELRFYAYFSKKINTNYQDIDKLWNARMEGQSMYFPYLRGRQNELLCLRELLDAGNLVQK